MLNKKITYGGRKWTISAIRFAEGERYYLLTNKRGDVAFVPASVIKE